MRGLVSMETTNKAVDPNDVVVSTRSAFSPSGKKYWKVKRGQLQREEAFKLWKWRFCVLYKEPPTLQIFASEGGALLCEHRLARVDLVNTKRERVGRFAMRLQQRSSQKRVEVLSAHSKYSRHWRGQMRSARWAWTPTRTPSPNTAQRADGTRAPRARPAARG